MAAAEGLVLAKTNIVERADILGQQPNSSPKAVPAMMKLAIFCAVKGGTSKGGGRGRETSSEGSSTYGGCLIFAVA